MAFTGEKPNISFRITANWLDVQDCYIKEKYFYIKSDEIDYGLAKYHFIGRAINERVLIIKPFSNFRKKARKIRKKILIRIIEYFQRLYDNSELQRE